MRKIGLFILGAVVLFSCKKSGGIHLVPGPTDSTEIVGNWVLEASRIGFAVGNQDTSWKPAVTSATILFASSGVFSSDGAYAYKDEQYDRYAYDPTAIGQFMLTATTVPSGNIPIYHAMVRLVNKDQLVISYMGVDYTPQELYTRK